MCRLSVVVLSTCIMCIICLIILAVIMFIESVEFEKYIYTFYDYTLPVLDPILHGFDSYSYTCLIFVHILSLCLMLHYCALN